MLEILYTTEAQIVLLLWALAMLVIVGYYVVRKFRDFTSDDTPQSSDLLTNFREMHLQGDIQDEEYRKIKTHMSTQLKTELKDADDTD